jgi:hypothetical protein
MYGLSRELNVSHLGSFASGLFYSFSTFHFAHAQAQMHVASMEWLPLLLLTLARSMRTLRLIDATAFGLSAAAAFLASTYNVLFGGMTILLLMLAGQFAKRGGPLTWRHATCASVAVGTFALTAGWLAIGMALSGLSEPYFGNHNSVRFSADLESFFVPNAVSLLSNYIYRSSAWTGSPWETAAYIGYAPLLLGLLVVTRLRIAFAFMTVAVVGGALALGPVLHIGGRLYPAISMPYQLLDAAFPPLRFSGLPVRFTWMTTLGVSVAAGMGTAFLARRGRWRIFAAIAIMTLGLVEAWPRHFLVTTIRQPTILVDLSSVSGNWAILDVTSWSRQLWHQMSHKHPIIGGYLSRVPSSRWHTVSDDPILAAFVPPPVGIQAARFSEPSKVVDRLRELRIRFVILEASRVGLISELDLVAKYQDDETAIFEVPSVSSNSVRK